MAAFDAISKKMNQKYGEKEKEEEKQQQSSGNPSFDSVQSKMESKYNPSSYVNEDYINTFISDAKNYLESAQSDYNQLGYTTASSILAKRNSAARDLSERRSAIQQYLEKNKSSLSEEGYNTIKSYLDNFGKVSGESLYAFYKAQEQYADPRFKGYDGGAAKQGWLTYIEDKNKLQTEEEDKKWYDWLLQTMGSTSDTTLPGATMAVVQNNLREDNSYREPNDKWGIDLRNAFGYLYSQDPEKAWEWAEDINNQLNAAEKEEQIKEIQEKATDSFGAGALHTAGALATAPFGLADYLSDIIESNARGTITTKDYLTPFEYSQAVTGGVTEHLNEEYGTLDEDIPIIGGKGLGDVYGLGTSMAQSSLAAASGGGGQALITFFGSAAASGVDDALARGASEDQAIMFGTLNGLAEAIPEMMSVDSLLNIGSADTMRELIMSIVKQGASEGIEEGMTSTLNLFADKLVMGDKSNFNILVQHYIAQGWSEEEAKEQAWKDTAEDIAYDVLGGFVSGSVHAAPVTAYQTYANNKNASETYGDSVQELIAEGLESAEGSLSHDLAMQYQAKVDSGSTLSGAEINRLVKANEQQFLAEDKAAIKQSAENRLVELGETDNVSGLAEILTKQATKQKLTRAEKQTLQASLYGQRVSNEMNPQNIKSGEYTSKWAQNIGTNRINTDTYNAELMALANEAAGVPAQQIYTSNQDTSEDAQSAKGTAYSTIGEQVVTPQNKTVSEGKYAVSDKGSTTLQETGEKVSIKEIASIKDGQMSVKLEDGRTVKASDVEYASQDEALVYESVASMGINASAANVLVNAYHTGRGITAPVYTQGIQEAYNYGTYNYPTAEVAKAPFASMLTEYQRRTAYRLGQMFGGKSVAKAQAAVRKPRTTAETTTKKEGKVHFDGDRGKLNERQSVSLAAMETVAEALGVQFYVFESQVNEEGKHTGANGWYDPKDSSIHIDLYAGTSGKDTMLFTVAHELTHFIKEWSPAKFKVLANFLMQEYGKKGVSVNSLVEAQIKKAKDHGRNISYDTAYEEVIADSMETMLADGKVAEKLAKLKNKDKGLWDKIKDFIADLAANIRAVYEGLSPDSKEGKYVAEMKDAIESLQDLFTEALVEAGENYQAAEKNTNKVSEKFQLRGIVEETKELIAVHNMTDTELKKSMDLGGLPMPSIAIIKAQNGHAEYGNVSLVFSKDTIDPKRLKSNKVYGGDAWTPTYPTIEYKANAQVVNRANSTIYEHIGKVPEYYQRSLRGFVGDMESYLNREGGESGLFSRFKDDHAMKALYLAEKGHLVEMVVKETRTETPAGEAEMYRIFSDKMGEAIDESVGRGVSGKEWYAKYGEEIKSAFRDYLKQDIQGLSDGDLDDIISSEKPVYYVTLARKAARYKENGGVTIKTVEDISATNTEIDTAIDASAYEKWLKDLFAGIEEKSGIRNNADPYTTSGNRRSFEALHWENNLENVVKAMKQQAQTGNGALFAGNALFGVASKEYGSISEIKADAKRLTKIPQEQYEAIKDSYSERFSEIARSIVDDGISNSFIALDAAMESIVDAVRSRKTKSGILSYLKAYNNKATSDTVDDIIALVTDISNMPTEYFEAKPQRAVGFDEVKAVILPDNVDAELMKGLESNNINAVVYEAGNEQARLEALNGLEGLKFSDRDSDGNHLSQDQQEYFKDSKVRDEQGRLLVMYHGTPNGSHTTFRSGSYFTENPEYANVYQAPGASALTHKKDASNPKVYKVYLNIKKPFDTRKAKERRIFMQEYYRKYGTGAPLADSGLPDWTDGIDLQDFIEEMEYDYDGLILDEGAVGGYGEEVVSRGLSYVTFSSEQVKNVDNLQPTSDPDIRYSERVTDKETLDFLNNQDTITTYKTMQLVDGKLYPPMAARTNGVYEDYSVLGAWEQATEHPELIKNGNKYKLDKGKGQGSIEAAYNPYMHSSNLVLNDQFSGAYTRDNLVTVECEVPVSELTSGYHAQYAKDSVGWHAWHTGTVAGSLRASRGIERQVFLSRWIKPVRIVPDSEVAAMYKKLLDGTDIAVPDNVVTPSLLKELKKAGVKIKESGRVKYSVREFDSSKEKIEKNITELAEISPVYAVPESKLDRTGKRPTDIFNEYFDTWGWNIFSEELGDVELRKSSVKSEIRHGITAEKIASIEAIPTVIKEGKIIFAGQKPDTTVYRIVICAPITIGKESYYMGVMVQRDANTQRLYLHNVAIEKETSESSPAVLLTTGANENNERLFITNILQNALSVKYRMQNGEIKWSDRDLELEKVNRVLDKENTQLKKDVSQLKELLKLQKSVTNGTKFTKTSVEAAAGHLMKVADAKGDKAELTKILDDFYGYIASSDYLTWDGIADMARPAAQWLINHEVKKRQLDDYASGILQELRGTRIYLDDLQQKEVAYQYGSYFEYRKRAMGSVIVANEGNRSIALDSKWQELSYLYPDVFDPDITSNDMPSALLDAVDRLRNMDISDAGYTYNEELAERALVSDIYDTYWRVSTLRTVADVKQKEINRLKGQHLKRMTELRDYHKEKTAQLKKEHRDELKKIKQEYREKSAAKQREIVERYQESRKRNVENRNKTEIRRKIRNVVDELNKYLLNGTKDRHVPIELQKAVADALDTVNMDTVGAQERIAKHKAEMLRAKSPEKIQEIAKTIERIQTMGDKMDARLKALKEAYDKFTESDDPLVANSHDEVISARIQSVIEKVGETPLRDMSIAQLEDVYDMYKMVLTTVRNTNKAFKAAKSESIAALGNRVMEEVHEAGGSKKYRLKGAEGIEKFAWNNLKPVYAFERIGSGTLTEIYNNVRSGEDTWARDITEAREYYLEKTRKYKYDSWDFDKRYQFTSSSGLKFELSLEQIMSLYAYSKREQAAEHLKRGGIVFDETTEVTVKSKMGIPLKFNPTEATAYNISEETLGAIIGKLSDTQRKFVDEMQDYLSTVMGEKGNEVTLEMYGIKLFKEKFYFPLKSATQFMAKAKEQQKGEVKIKNSGFSKETVRKANNPIVLTPFMDVWSDHVNEMSMYHAFVLPMEDFYRVYNYKTPTSETMQTESVEMYIQNAYGRGATKYIDQLLKDLNGGAVSDPRESPAKMWMSRYKKAAVMASLSVIVQQPTAIVRAMALVDARHFGVAPISRGIIRTVNSKKHKALWSEIKQYAPVAVIKEMGHFDTNMGKSAQDFIKGKEYNTLSEKAKGFFTDSDYRDEKISRAAALADELAWVSIWEAVKRETVSTHKSLRPGSEEFLKIVGERFTEVVTKTQVYDSVLARSGNMRSKTAFMNMWTSFMAEPTTSINMLEDALRKAKRGNKRYAAKAIGAVYGSVILNAALVSLVYAMRDDDEDETFTEKYVSRFVTEIIDGLNPLTYIPFLKDVWSIMQGFDIERADMSLITDLVDSLQQVTKILATDTEGMDEEELAAHQKKVKDALWSIADNISSLAGVPTKNVRRDFNGIRNLFETIGKDSAGRNTTVGSLLDKIQADVKSSTPVVGWLPNESKGDKLYDAIVSGDTAYAERLKSSYASQTSVDTAIRKALRENDPRIREAAVAWNAGDLSEYMRIAKEIIAEKHFVQDNVVMAIRTEAESLEKSESTSSSSSKAKGLFTADSFAEAIAQGDTAMANAIKVDIIQTAQKNGKTLEEAEKSFASSAKSASKELFLAGEISEVQAVKTLTTYCDVEQEDAEETVGEWAFEAEYGFTYSDRGDAYKSGAISAAELKNILMNVGGKTEEEADLQVQVYDWQKEVPGADDITASAISDYNEYCEAAGISKSVYYEAWTAYKDTDGDYDVNGDSIPYSKVQKVMPYINSLPLTSAQKTALAKCWWAEATVHKYKLW